MTDLGNKTVVVAGMARSGIAAVELLVRHGAIVYAVDQRPMDALGAAGRRLQELGVPLLPQTEQSFSSANLIVLSPGVPLDIEPLESARQRGIPIIGEVELAYSFLEGPVIGITGSNGKTTTTAMIGHILGFADIAAQVGGNIGMPPTAIVAAAREGQWNVLELSSFQLETIHEFRARIAVCMNVTPDHLDRHGTFDNYANAKARLFETQTSADFAVLNADDPTCVAYASRTPAQTWWFSSTRSLSPGAWLENDAVMLDGKLLLSRDEIPLPGLHNIENTMAAAIACHLAGASFDRIAAGIKSFPGVEHRLEFVREINGVKYYNDSKATNVDATEKAVDAFAGGLWIILGGKDKNSDYTPLLDKLRKKARRVLLIGAASDKIAAQLQGLPLVHSGTLATAVQTAAAEAASGEIVLLAPACASFDQFDNFEHRGRVFKEAVRAL